MRMSRDNRTVDKAKRPTEAQATTSTPARAQRPGLAVQGSSKIVNTLLPGFSRQLAAMLSSGMSIVGALDALEEQSDNRVFQGVVANVRKSIEGGKSFSEALSQYPSIFDKLYRNMVAGGETSGQMAETIGRLASFLEAGAKLRRRIKSASMYPIIVLCLATIITALMVIFIVPMFGEMYADFGGQLPGPTRFLVATSDFLRNNALIVSAVVIAVVTLLSQWKRSSAGELVCDKLLLRLPVFGELNRKVISARFARTYAQMTRSGVPVLQTLAITAGATGNRVSEQIVMNARSAVEKGEPLSSALLEQTVFPIALVRMLQAGEKTGRVDDMMDNIADFYEDEVDITVSALTSLLEPLLIVMLGIIIGGIVICMFLPIFRLPDIISGQGQAVE